MQLFLTILLSIFLTSCGDVDDSVPTLQNQEQAQDGDFGVRLESLNGSGITAVANFTAGDHFNASVAAQNATPSSTEKQFILTGNACPTAASDTDGNGQISATEAFAASGAILIPLDNDLTTQAADGVYPLADAAGAYTYEGSTSMEDLIDDLRDPDEDTADNLVKLNPDELLNMEGRVIMIQETRGAEDIPVACGVIGRGSVGQ